MGKNKASMQVADVPEAEFEREFQQQQIFTQLQEFHETLTMMNLRHDDLQHHIVDRNTLSLICQSTVLDRKTSNRQCLKSSVLSKSRTPPHPFPRSQSVPLSLLRVSFSTRIMFVAYFGS
ncbi:hypothetical protein C1H46_029231 [Malus baccata]|uniref:Uncharacterized protein n=1 Tax=Malus baccata TaxID=106549 RepID=A0A540LFG2_MALBA|nr:hypothetical protein C1H46_029231 [Malus baccata]